jgi:hypothetical protein
LRPKATGFVPGKDAKRHSAESMNCSRADHTGW